MTYIPTDFNNSAGADSFGRTRVSEPYTLFDSSFRFNNSVEKWDTAETNNSGNVDTSFNSVEGLMNLTVGTSTGDQIIRETKRVFAYQPGKSLLVLNSFTMATAKENLRQRVGYFGSNCGIFLEQDGSEIYFVKRANGIDTRILQQNWSEDRLDGTGGSKIELDLSKSQIFWCDIEWLGVGSVRCGFVINGNFYTCHIFHHANIDVSTYMLTASLPIRYEITNSNNTDSDSTMKQICSTVISEGGFSQRNITRSASIPVTTPISFSNAGDRKGIIAIRLRENYTDSIVVPFNIDLYGFQNTPFQFQLIRNSSITGGSWVYTDSISTVEYNRTMTNFSGGTILLEGTFKGQTSYNRDLIEYDNQLQLTRNINAIVGEVFLLAIICTSNQDSVLASLSWMEHTT
jgi:hypothetical protein